MTREHKLALIVGFSLVLVLGVLLSDHLSTRNRNSRPPLATVTSGTPQDFGGENTLAESSSSSTPVPPPAGAVRGAPSRAGPAPTDPLNASQHQAAATEGPRSTPVELSMLNTMRPQSPEALAGMRAEPLPPSSGTPVVSGSQVLPNPTNLPVSKEPVRRHDVRENESIYTVAKRYYQDGTLWTKLRDYPANAGKISPKGQVREGVALAIPPKDVLLGKAVAADPRLKQDSPPSADAGPQRPTAATGAPLPTTSPQPAQSPQTAKDTKLATYSVRAGDTLASIARQRLGSAARAKEIIALNRSLADDPDSLSVGQEIRLPAR